MDARPHARFGCACCLLLALAGCSWPNVGNSAAPNPKTDNQSAGAHSEVVANDSQANADIQPAADAVPDLGPVQRWIEQVSRIDDVQSRLSYPGVSTPLPPPIETSSLPSPDEPGAEAAAAKPDAGVEAEDDAPPSPPVLRNVTIRAAPAADIRPPTRTLGDQPQTAVNSSAEAQTTIPSLQQFAEAWFEASDDPSFRNQLDARLLCVLAGEYEKAGQPLELVSNEQQQMAGRLVDMLIAIRDGHGGDPSAEASRVLNEVKLLEESLVPLGDLNITALAITRAVRGYGRYDVVSPADFPAGRENEFVVYCQIENFVSRERDDQTFESQFSMRTTVLSRAGDTVLDINDEHITDECRTRRRDCFIPRLVHLPATLSPGQYVVKVTIVDKIAGKVAEKRTTFRIVARS